jgi:hypothetical protein
MAKMAAKHALIDLTDSPPRRDGKKEVVVIDVDDNEQQQPQRAENRPSKRVKRDAKPLWHGFNGAKRLMAEFQEMQAEIALCARGAPCGPARLSELRFHEDNMCCWRMEVRTGCLLALGTRHAFRFLTPTAVRCTDRLLTAS